MLTAYDVIQYYLNNPPFETNDQAKLTIVVNQAKEQTLLELSENNPIIEEKIFTTPQNTSSEFVLIDIYTDIDDRFLSFILLTPTNHLESYLLPFQNYIPIFPLKEGSYLEIIAIRDGIEILREATATYIQKIIFQGRKIKLKQNTEYYCLYNRYKNLDEITPNEMDAFIKLFEVNFFINAYQSSLFTSEQGIRSVSISGLSVSLNVPQTESVTKTLAQKKAEILSELALTDYDGLIGHW